MKFFRGLIRRRKRKSEGEGGGKETEEERKCHCEIDSDSECAPASTGPRVIDLHPRASLRSQPLIKTFTFSTASLSYLPQRLGRLWSRRVGREDALVTRRGSRKLSSPELAEMRGGREREREIKSQCGRILIRFWHRVGDILSTRFRKVW